MPESILRYFPSLSELQKVQISQLKQVFDWWNSRINVISRRDIDNFYIHHVLHSLSIARVISFLPGTNILDAGTGGGFPGIPLAIAFPDSEFTLVDSIEKKIKVVSSVCKELDLKNVTPSRKRIEEESGKYDFVVSRAVTVFPGFVKMTLKNIAGNGRNKLENGILYLKGGGLDKELSHFRDRVFTWYISAFFSEPYFSTKKIVYLPV